MDGNGLGLDPTAALTFSEISDLNQRKLAIKREHAAYIDTHPEIKSMLNDFMSAVLLNKPGNVFEFANEHFAELSPEHAQGVSPAGYMPIVVCGPSGVGKGTLIGLLMKSYPSGFGFCVSHTTRAPRPGETDGVHYHFSTRDAMQQGIEDGKFVEYADVHGNLYGTSFDAVQAIRDAGRICVLDIDVQGCESVKKSKLAPRYLFVKPPDMEALEDRLRDRATESEADILKRLDNAKKELEYGTEDNFDHVLTNAVLEESFAGLCKLLEDNWFPHLKGAVDKGDGYGPEDSEDEGEEEEEEGKGGEEKE